MSSRIPEQHPLRKLFRDATQWAFRYTEFADPRARDPELRAYLSEDLLTRFLHVDQLYRLRDARGHALADVAEMLISGEVEGASPEVRSLTIQRHIGDYALFISGLFPEHLARVTRDRGRRDGMMVQLGSLLVPFRDASEYYEQAGRRAYRHASEIGKEIGLPAAEIFATLSDCFADYTRALNLIRIYLDASPAFAEQTGLIM